jgi:hypothetical protein
LTGVFESVAYLADAQFLVLHLRAGVLKVIIRRSRFLAECGVYAVDLLLVLLLACAYLVHLESVSVSGDLGGLLGDLRDQE